MKCDGIGCGGCEICQGFEDPGLEAYIARCADDCSCCDTCCSNVCGGVLQGGPCDKACSCEDEYDQE